MIQAENDEGEQVRILKYRRNFIAHTMRFRTVTSRFCSLLLRRSLDCRKNIMG
jgi:hypothetical protein